MKYHFPEAVLSRITEVLEGKFAFRVAKTCWGDLEKAIAEAAATSGFTPEKIAALATEASCPDYILKIFVQHLTIGETYFFRYPEQFVALEQSILPTIVASKRAGGVRRIAVWSAGCSSGEEAYSLAMLLTRAIPDYREWEITIIATDINEKALETAKKGIYGDWSFRGLDEAFKLVYFDPVSGKEASVKLPRAYRVKPEIRNMVRFSQLNLAQPSWTESAASGMYFDIVFCRNVLMYFQQAVALDILRHLREHLAAGGCLAVAPIEASAAQGAGFSAQRFSDCSLFGEEEKSIRKIQSAVKQKIFSTEEVAAVVPLPRDKTTTASAPAPKMAATPLSSLAPRSAPSLTVQAYAAANAGNLELAGELLEQALTRDATDYSAHYLRAVLAMESGNIDEAHSALEKALFLHPDFIPAMLMIGNVTRWQGRHAEAARHFRSAAQVLRSMDPAAVVPDSECLTAGSLLQIATALYEAEKQSR